MQLLDDNSILRQVPAALNPKQALFIDGIRHAAEIIDVAYSRLRNLLTENGLKEPNSSALPKISSHAFLDAWAIIDAIDRFRMLYTQMPGISFSSGKAGEITFQELAQPFRDLRNVADHLSQRADFVLSKSGSALGMLTWVTGFQVEPTEIWYCTLRPGTARDVPELTSESFETTIDWPTDQITLLAGGYAGNISQFLPEIKKRIKHFEGQLQKAFSEHGLLGTRTISDVYTRQPYVAKEGHFTRLKS